MNKKQILWIVGLNIASYFLAKTVEKTLAISPMLAQTFLKYFDVNFYYAVFVAFLNIVILSVILRRHKKQDASIPVKNIANERAPNLIFYDNFDEDKEWKKYGDGEVNKSDDVFWCGKFSLKKDSNPDPCGGYRLLGRKIETPFIFSGWIFRSDIDSRGERWADRLAIENQDNNGYGICISHGNSKSYVERRISGRGRGIGSASIYTPPLNKWYQFIMYFGADGLLKLYLYGASGVCIADVPEVRDNKYNQFDRIVVHGGYPYYIDDLKIIAT